MDANKVRDSVEYLRKRDRSFHILGATGHRWQLNPTLTHSEIESIEKEYRFRLPGDAKEFFFSVGNGGAGPNYGVFKLGVWPDSQSDKKWTEIFSEYALAKPFPFTEAWNMPAEFFEQEPDIPEIEDASYIAEEERWNNLVEQEYWAEKFMYGAFPISEIGCAAFEWLVVNGPETGKIWCDARADYRGIFPLLNEDGTHQSFEQWYMDWLRACLEQFPPKKTLLKRLFSMEP